LQISTTSGKPLSMAFYAFFLQKLTVTQLVKKIPLLWKLNDHQRINKTPANGSYRIQHNPCEISGSLDAEDLDYGFLRYERKRCFTSWCCQLLTLYRVGGGAQVEWYWPPKTDVFKEKLVPVPLCPPQIPHRLARDL
jgi:hypothetical protein